MRELHHDYEQLPILGHLIWYGLADADQRGYVWLPFDILADAARLQALGAQLIAAISQPGWKIEPRAIHAVTRLLSSLDNTSS